MKCSAYINTVYAPPPPTPYVLELLQIGRLRSSFFLWLPGAALGHSTIVSYPHFLLLEFGLLPICLFVL